MSGWGTWIFWGDVIIAVAAFGAGYFLRPKIDVILTKIGIMR